MCAFYHVLFNPFHSEEQPFDGLLSTQMAAVETAIDTGDGWWFTEL